MPSVSRRDRNIMALLQGLGSKGKEARCLPGGFVPSATGPKAPTMAPLDREVASELPPDQWCHQGPSGKAPSYLGLHMHTWRPSWVPWQQRWASSNGGGAGQALPAAPSVPSPTWCWTRPPFCPPPGGLRDPQAVLSAAPGEWDHLEIPL